MGELHPGGSTVAELVLQRQSPDPSGFTLGRAVHGTTTFPLPALDQFGYSPRGSTDYPQRQGELFLETLQGDGKC